MNNFGDTAFDAFISDLPRPNNPVPSRHHGSLVDITTTADDQPVYLDMQSGHVIRNLEVHDWDFSRPQL